MPSIQRVLRFVLPSAALTIAFITSSTARADQPAPKKTSPASSTSTTAARIDDSAEPSAHPVPPQPQPDKVEKAETKDDFKNVSLEINPLAATIGRYSIQGEYLPTPHHAVTVNPFFAHAPVKVTINGQEVDGGSLNGFGGELGYRFYTGTKGPNGFFVGPSVILASYSQSAPSGVVSEGLKTMELPQASAGAPFQAAIWVG